MSRFAERFTRIFVFLLIGLSVIAWSCDGDSKEVRVELPAHKWELILFKEIDKVTKLAGIEQLKKTKLKKDDLEVRVWRGFGLSPLEGVILTFRDNQWSARHVNTDRHIDPEEAEIRELAPPKSGWQVFWNRLVDKKILTLPDAAEINCQSSQYDGIGFVVEIKKNSTYRTYMYGSGKCSEARLMEEIGEIIGLEFGSGQEECKTAEWFACMSW